MASRRAHAAPQRHGGDGHGPLLERQGEGEVIAAHAEYPRGGRRTARSPIWHDCREVWCGRLGRGRGDTLSAKSATVDLRSASALQIRHQLLLGFPRGWSVEGSVEGWGSRCAVTSRADARRAPARDVEWSRTLHRGAGARAPSSWPRGQDVLSGGHLVASATSSDDATGMGLGLPSDCCIGIGVDERSSRRSQCRRAAPEGVGVGCCRS